MAIEQVKRQVKQDVLTKFMTCFKCEMAFFQILKGMRTVIVVFLLIFTVCTEGVCQSDTPAFMDTSYMENLPIPQDRNMEKVKSKYIQKKEEEKARQAYFNENIQRKDFKKKDWEKATAGLDYTIEKEKANKPTAKKKTDKSSSPLLNAGWVTFLKWFFIIIALAIIVILVAKFVKEGNVFGQQSRRIFAPSMEISLQNIEDDLNQAELFPLIQQAIAQKQFALALRLYYLATIKELNAIGAIQWKKDKTNREYTREMKNHRLFMPFRDITTVFERVWYGDAPIDESAFNHLQPAFQDLLNQAKKV